MSWGSRQSVGWQKAGDNFLHHLKAGRERWYGLGVVDHCCRLREFWRVWRLPGLGCIHADALIPCLGISVLSNEGSDLGLTELARVAALIMKTWA